MRIRLATEADTAAILSIVVPVIRAGETYALDRDTSEANLLAYWLGADRETFVAEDGGRIVGTYFLRANQAGGGGHVANCGYITDVATIGQGVARGMCEHSLGRAIERGFRAMQFNFVVSSNERAVRLWTSLGFETVGRLPEAFRHPQLGFVDALVMFRRLGQEVQDGRQSDGRGG
jgi:ribosomal protein S18 acetylase RimI-like enzyme